MSKGVISLHMQLERLEVCREIKVFFPKKQVYFSKKFTFTVQVFITNPVVSNMYAVLYVSE